MNTDAVLLVGHGTVTDLHDMAEFLRRIRRGRPASEALVAEITRRYRAIGGSPLLEWTRKQERGLEERLGLPVRIGMRLWHPFIEEGLRTLAGAGARRIVVLPLAPFSVHVYHAAAADEAKRLFASGSADAPRLLPVPPWGTEPALVSAHARAVGRCLEGKQPDSTALVLSAHSLPRSVIESGDPYQAQFESACRAILDELGWPARIAYQSQGEGGGDWLGPDLAETLESVRREGKREVVIAPVGFLGDHVETLYDLDIEARSQAEKMGLSLTRVSALNDDPGLVEAMATIVRRALAA